MSTDVSDEDEAFKSALGEGEHHMSYTKLIEEEIIVPKSLSFQEASKCLHMLGKDESGMRYAYLMITATDRKLTEVSVLVQFTHVLFLDLSGNKLTTEALRCLADMPYLLYLKVSGNIIETCDLDVMHFLQVLDFSRNKITYTNGVKQPMLECLDLSFNFIEIIDLVDMEASEPNVPNLKQLELRGNVLDALCGIYPTSITTLYLAENHISTLCVETLLPLVNLQRLHLRDNMIRRLEGFGPTLKSLKYLNLRKNSIAKINQLLRLMQLPALSVLVIIGNPICPEGDKLAEGGGDDEDEELGGEEEEPLDPFRVDVLVILPGLKRINKKIVTVEERLAAEAARKKRKQEIMDEPNSIEEVSVVEENW